MVWCIVGYQEVHDAGCLHVVCVICVLGCELNSNIFFKTNKDSSYLVLSLCSTHTSLGGPSYTENPGLRQENRAQTHRTLKEPEAAPGHCRSCVAT